MSTEKEGYKGHRVGSNKGKVHEIFDTKGKDAAVKKAVSLGLEETTARTWCSSWAAGKKKKVAAPAKKAATKTAKKAKPAKKAAPTKRTIKRFLDPCEVIE
jgi:hypothetical protein